MRKEEKEKKMHKERVIGQKFIVEWKNEYD
jgi:hypothetical protein